jgi:histidyl-tRNA synthetase
MYPNKNTGEFYLYGNNEEHQYVYWYLQICNYNKLNKKRLDNKEAMFYEIDEDVEAKNIIRKKTQKFEVERYVLEVGNADLKRIALALGWGDTKSEAVLRKEVLDFASNNPSVFENMIKDTKSIETLSVIKKAFDTSVIEFSEVERTVTLANNVIATLARVEGKQKHEQLDEYLKTTRNGDKIYENIKKLVTQKNVA